MFDDEHIIKSNIAARNAEKNTIISDVEVDQWEALVRQMIKSIEILPIFDGSEFQGFAYTEEG